MIEQQCLGPWVASHASYLHLRLTEKTHMVADSTRGVLGAVPGAGSSGLLTHSGFLRSMDC